MTTKELNKLVYFVCKLRRRKKRRRKRRRRKGGERTLIDFLMSIKVQIL